jgi:Co/Zn/Cd efflux system component
MAHGHDHRHGHHGHKHGRHADAHGEGHGHTHGVVDPSIASTDRGLWALKWSFLGLMATAAVQLVVVVLSNSVGLLADTIHNFADAATAIPLGIAFLLARRTASRRFTYGLGVFCRPALLARGSDHPNRRPFLRERRGPPTDSRPAWQSSWQQRPRTCA